MPHNSFSSSPVNVPFYPCSRPPLPRVPFPRSTFFFFFVCFQEFLLSLPPRILFRFCSPYPFFGSSNAPVTCPHPHRPARSLILPVFFPHHPVCSSIPFFFPVVFGDLLQPFPPPHTAVTINKCTFPFHFPFFFLPPSPPIFTGGFRSMPLCFLVSSTPFLFVT